MAGSEGTEFDILADIPELPIMMNNDKAISLFGFRHSSLIRHSGFVIRHSSVKNINNAGYNKRMANINILTGVNPND